VGLQRPPVEEGPKQVISLHKPQARKTHASSLTNLKSHQWICACSLTEGCGQGLRCEDGPEEQRCLIAALGHELTEHVVN